MVPSVFFNLKTIFPGFWQLMNLHIKFPPSLPFRILQVVLFTSKFLYISYKSFINILYIRYIIESQTSCVANVCFSSLWSFSFQMTVVKIQFMNNTPLQFCYFMLQMFPFACQSVFEDIMYDLSRVQNRLNDIVCVTFWGIFSFEFQQNLVTLRCFVI